MDQLIARISLLSENDNPYTVSKEIEEIKSIFYIKLKLEKEEKTTPKAIEEQKENTKKASHPLEVKFKAVLSAYRKIKSKFRKHKEKEEKINLKTKRQIIEDIDALSKEEESIKITFEKFRALQEKWKNTGHVPLTKNNHLWQSYHHHVELFYDFIKLNNDLRDLDFKRNLEGYFSSSFTIRIIMHIIGNNIIIFSHHCYGVCKNKIMNIRVIFSFFRVNGFFIFNNCARGRIVSNIST